jgi:CheY-like chemotaxis protein
MICEERSRLLREYSGAANSYAISVSEVAKFVMSGDEVRAAEARRTARKLLEAAEKSRVALYKHEANHTCDRMVDLRSGSETLGPLAQPQLLTRPIPPPPTEIPQLSLQPIGVRTPGPILILEDDISIRNLICRLLERRGYFCVQIEQAQDLAAELRQRSAELLVIDVSTTKGVETAIALARTHPNFRILALTGKTLDGQEIPGRLQALLKPFALDSLVDCVDCLLNRSGTTSG